MNNKGAFLLAAFALLAACDYIDRPIVGASVPPPTNSGVQRHVVLEEFTGHKCTTCPAAHAIAAQLKSVYGDKLIIVGEHVGSLAAPAAAPFTDDFRTPASDAYFASNWHSDIIPRAAVSRIQYPSANNWDLPKTVWGEAIASIVDQPAIADMWFDQLAFNGSNTVDASVKVAVSKDLGGATYNLTVYITEDSVVAAQSDENAPGGTVLDYVHRYMLRDNLNGTWGQPVLSSTNVIGDTVTLDLPAYTFQLGAGESWNGSNCSLVAYVYNTTTYEIVQAVERRLVP